LKVENSGKVKNKDIVNSEEKEISRCGTYNVFLRRFLPAVEMTGVCEKRGEGKNSGEAAVFSLPSPENTLSLRA